MHGPTSGPGTLRRVLASPAGFATVVELVPWAGELTDSRGEKPLRTAADLAGEPRITALSVTDNAGGHVRLSPDAPAEALVALGHDVIVHVACRDRNRNGLQSLGWDLLSRGLTTILAVTGDYPVEGFNGLSKPVFDVDSVGLVGLYRELSDAAIARVPASGGPAADRRALYLGVAVDVTKRHERELVPQLLKLALKVRVGADFVIGQVSYDARAQGTLIGAMHRAAIAVPAIANAYILDRGVARAFHAGRIPGCVVTDELLALVERQAGSPDRGRAFFLEFAAKQAAVAQGLGYRGVYLSGHRDATEIVHVLELAEAFAPHWRALARDVMFGIPGAFRLFEADPETGLDTDQLSQSYAASSTAAARRRARRGVPLTYKVNRTAHDRVFAPDSPGFRTWRRAYGKIEAAHVGRPLHVLEQAVKVPLYDCRDCGDCSLPDVAYLCPESHCVKNQRNGPCGGSHDGRCEVGDRPCVWAEAYRRLKPYGEELAMLDRPPVIVDNGLRRTSAWANTFLGRDHFGAAAARAARTTATTPESPEKGHHP